MDSPVRTLTTRAQPTGRAQGPPEDRLRRGDLRYGSDLTDADLRPLRGVDRLCRPTPSGGQLARWEAVNRHLVMLDRERAGREASPSAAVIGSQSVRTTESGGPRGQEGPVTS